MASRTARLVSLVVLLITLLAMMAEAPASALPAGPPRAAAASDAAPITVYPADEHLGQSSAPTIAAPDCGPDLIPYTPTGYSYPVVPSSIKNTLLADTVLFTGHPTYFDFEVGNVGTSSAAAFYVDVWLDGIHMFRGDMPSLTAGYWNWFKDAEYIVQSDGVHTVAMVVDPTNAIVECDESNNYWERDFTWEVVNAWWGEYFNNMNLAGDPVLVRDEFINFDWPASPGPGVNADAFSVRWRRDIDLNASTYYFTLGRDNGMRFYFDDVLVYDEWSDTVSQDGVILDIIPGQHTMQVELFDSGGSASAHFERKPCYDVSNGVTPTGSGAINISPAPDCNTKYTGGQNVTLTANPAAGYTFNHWSGDVTGTQNPITVLLQTPKSVTAHFTQTACYALTTAVNPAGSGSIATSPPPNCPGGLYTPGTVVTLTANANNGYTFSSWGGDVAGASNPRNITMNGNRSVTGNFTPVAAYTLTVNTNGPGSVDVVPFKAAYAPGETVTLTAVPGAGAVFSGWSGELSGTDNPIALVMTSSKSVTAHFAVDNPDCWPLALRHTGQGGNPQATPAQSTGCIVGSYVAGAAVQLSAGPTVGWHVAGWRGTANDSTTAAANSLVMPNAAHTVWVDYVQTPTTDHNARVPLVLFGPIYGYQGLFEIDPNDSADQATGPLLLNRVYKGYSNDGGDWFSFNLATSTRLVITLDIPQHYDVQVALFRETTAPGTAEENDTQAPHHITYLGTPGRYWVRILFYGDYDDNSTYSLLISSTP